MREAIAKMINPADTPLGIMAGVAKSDEQAQREFRPRVIYFFGNLARMTTRHRVPPGYVSAKQIHARASSGHDKARCHFDWDFATQHHRIIAGATPK